jgi:hypothetical protein
MSLQILSGETYSVLTSGVLLMTIVVPVAELDLNVGEGRYDFLFFGI